MMLSSKKSGQVIKQPGKRKLPHKLALTPEIQALYFGCLAGKSYQLTTEDRQLIVEMLHQRFPALKREARRITTPLKRSFWKTLFNWMVYLALIMLGVAALLLALESYASAQENATVLPYPTPLHAVEPQDTRIQTTVDGIDHMQTKAILSDDLAGDQLEVVRKIVDDGTSIAEKRLELEHTKFHAEKHLEFLRITQRFILWGFVASIPFIFTLFWVFKHLFGGYHTLQKEKLAYKIKELESVERQIALTEERYSDSHKRDRDVK